MSMYSLVHGTNAASDFLLAILNLTRADVGRFRDAWVTEEGEIAVYTRNGGGNREHYGEYEADPECHCTGCTIEVQLPKHPLYLRDADDAFDSTYATVWFKVPDDAKPLLAGLEQARNPDEEWQKAIEALKAGKRPDVERALNPVIEQIAASLQRG